MIAFIGWLWVADGAAGVLLAIKNRRDCMFSLMFGSLAALEVFLGTLLVRGNL